MLRVVCKVMGTELVLEGQDCTQHSGQTLELLPGGRMVDTPGILIPSLEGPGHNRRKGLDIMTYHGILVT